MSVTFLIKLDGVVCFLKTGIRFIYSFTGKCKPFSLRIYQFLLLQKNYFLVKDLSFSTPVLRLILIK